MSVSDSSEDEDLSRFKEAVDTSFTKLIEESRFAKQYKVQENKSIKSDRYLETSTHYNDVKVPEEMQKRIGAKVSAIIHRNIEFVDVELNELKKRRIKGGVKLFKGSDGFLSCEDVKDSYTEIHNSESRKLSKKKRKIDADDEDLNELEKSIAVAVSGEYILAKEETKCWRSRRKEKLYKYKSLGKSKTLVSVE